MTRELSTPRGIDLSIQLYTPVSASLASNLNQHKNLEIIDPELDDFTKIPFFASRKVLEQSENYDMVGYMEDDIYIVIGHRNAQMHALLFHQHNGFHK